MPSDAAVKIAKAWYHDKEDVDAQESWIVELSAFLDSMGVGDAFAVCDSIRMMGAEHGCAESALRKAGLA